jgi:phage-related protein
MSLETFPILPQYVLQEEAKANNVRMEFQTGDVTVWPLYHKLTRSWRLRWNVGSEDEAEKLKAFLRHHKGAETAFQWQRQPNNPLPRPYLAPIVEEKTGGSTSPRTLYVGYSWSDGSLETASSYKVAVVPLTTNITIQVTTQPFPEHVTEARVYVGISASALKLQTPVITDPDIGWTEPATGYDTGGAAPPSTNAMTETVKIYAREDSLDVRKLTARVWGLSVLVTERMGI